jgi:hypothetical protein
MSINPFCHEAGVSTTSVRRYIRAGLIGKNNGDIIRGSGKGRAIFLHKKLVSVVQAIKRKHQHDAGVKGHATRCSKTVEDLYANPGTEATAIERVQALEEKIDRKFSELGHGLNLLLEEATRPKGERDG